MPRNAEQKVKLLVLYDILQRNTDDTHALNTDEIIAELEKRGITVARKVLPNDIEILNEYGFEVLSYKKKFHYYYIVEHLFDTAEVVMLADAIKASKLTTTQKNQMLDKLFSTMGAYLAKKDSETLISLETTKRTIVMLIGIVTEYKPLNWGVTLAKSWRNNFLEQKIIRNHDEDTYMYVKGDFEPIISEEIWDQCKALRDSKTAKRVDARGNSVEKGERRSENIWVKKLVCKCGSHFRMDKWHINKTGITYGYKCYNILNNGSKQARIEAGLDTTGYCDMGTIADWKMDMMVWNLLKQLHMHIDSIAQKSYNYYDRGCKTIQHTNTDEIEQLTEKLNREQRKLENLTEMRAGGEIRKEEYQENKYKVNSNILKLEQRIDELKRKARAAKNGSESKLSTDEFRRIIEEQMDFSKPQISRGLIEALVNKVVPNDSHDLNWYMNLKPHVSDNDYECIGEFVIHFAEAKAYREMRGEMLRSNQWTDLTVRIFI